MKENSDNRYLVTVIDCFSRINIIVLIINKEASIVAEALRTLWEIAKVQLCKLQTKARKFYRSSFQSMLSKNKM